MSNTGECVIHTDGAARGNPGPAAYAFVIEVAGQRPVEELGFLGETTNNIAEYTAMVRALDRAHQLNLATVTLHSDSELMVKQMRGQYKVRNEGILPLYNHACKLVELFDKVTFRHVRREYNKRADQLCNDVLDSPSSYPPAQTLIWPPKGSVGAAKDKSASQSDAGLVSGPGESGPGESGSGNTKRAKALLYLTRCIEQWRNGDESAPTAEDVLDRIETLWGK